MADLDLIRKRAADHERVHKKTYGGTAYDDRAVLLNILDRLRELALDSVHSSSPTDAMWARLILDMTGGGDHERTS